MILQTLVGAVKVNIPIGLAFLLHMLHDNAQRLSWEITVLDSWREPYDQARRIVALDHAPVKPIVLELAEFITSERLPIQGRLVINLLALFSVQGYAHVKLFQCAGNFLAILGKNLGIGVTVKASSIDRWSPILEHVGQLATGLVMEVHSPATHSLK